MLASRFFFFLVLLVIQSVLTALGKLSTYLFLTSSDTCNTEKYAINAVTENPLRHWNYPIPLYTHYWTCKLAQRYLCCDLFWFVFAKHVSVLSASYLTCLNNSSFNSTLSKKYWCKISPSGNFILLCYCTPRSGRPNKHFVTQKQSI